MLWIIIMLGSALFFALSHIYGKKLLETTEVLDMVIAVDMLWLVALIPLIGYVDYSVGIVMLLLILVTTIFGYIGFVSINMVYKECEISSVGPLLSLSPLVLLVLASVFLGEKITIYQLMGIVLIIIGGYVITLKNWKRFLRPFTAIRTKFYLLIGLCIIAYSLGATILRVVMLNVDIITYMFFFSLFAFIILFLLMILRNRTQAVFNTYRSRWKIVILILGLALVSEVLHAWAFSMPDIMISLSIPVKRMSSLFMVLLGGTFFREKNLLQKSVASLLMIAGLFVIGSV